MRNCKASRTYHLNGRHFVYRLRATACTVLYCTQNRMVQNKIKVEEKKKNCSVRIRIKRKGFGSKATARNFIKDECK